jgi:hypothetical protein
MTGGPTTRRSFFGLAGGAALFCTIDGKQVDLSAPGGLAKADAAASRVRRPRAAAALAVPQIQPAPGGTRREYRIQAEFRGLFGAIVIRPKGAKQPDRSYALFVHQLPPSVTRLRESFHCINGRAYAGNTPTLTARVGEDVEIHAFGMDSNFHTFHIHGHRWRDPAGAFIDNPAMGPNECVTARFVEDNPGRWMYHCHVFSHQDAGMTGWYVVDP